MFSGRSWASLCTLVISRLTMFVDRLFAVAACWLSMLSQFPVASEPDSASRAEPPAGEDEIVVTATVAPRSVALTERLPENPLQIGTLPL